MGLFAYIKSLFLVPTNRPELALAQFRALTKQVPLLYFLLIINTAFVAFTHYEFAPLALTIYLPGAFLTICFARLIGWWRAPRDTIDGVMAAKRLRSTVVIAAVFGILMSVWAISLYPYGGMEEKAHVALFMAITTIACIFCLTHLRAAAIALAIVTVAPFGYFFGSMGSTVMTAVAFNMILVCSAMIYTLSIHAGEFNTMVEQKLDLEKTNAESIRLGAENHKFANLDSLTGMPNRRRFFAELESSIASAQAQNKIVAVGLIDLDGFKAVNDLFGHGAGDELLFEASKRMQTLAYWKVFLARLGGDEFGFVLECDQGQQSARQFGEALCEILALQYVLGEITADVSASCGVAMYPNAGTSAAKLLEFADYALYQAKDEGKGGVVIFTPSHHEQLRSVHILNQALRNANLETEFSLDFQPIVSSTTGRVASFEALARWNSPIVGAVSPARFICIAERSNMIDRLTVVLFEKFLQHLNAWPEEISASFNLSARNLASSETTLQILALIQKSGVAPQRIEFEVTETAVMADYERALKTLTLLRNLGAKIALDDFGTGYSSLGYVHKLPLDKIKIDRSFIVDIEHSDKAKKIVQTIVGMCRNLNLPSVAEGVENQMQAKAIADIGCTYIQGYYFNKPLHADEVLNLINCDLPVQRGSIVA